MSRPRSALTRRLSDAVDWTDVRLHRVDYEAAAQIFTQGDPATSVM
jgi:hypothetical protein